MIEIKVNEIMNWHYNGYKDEIYKTHIVKGNTLKECFPKVYDFERSARYDNARRYEIADPELHKAYQNWKQTGVTIKMYYGSATVD